MMKKNILLAICGMMLSTLGIHAQDKIEGNMSVDFVSQYIWRGQNLGSAAVQPTLGVSWNGLSLSAWGNVGITDASDTKEFDLTLGYSKGGFNVGVTDYWFSDGQEPQGRYFIYQTDKTNHVFEGNVGYDFGFLNLQWFTNFAGNDGFNESGNRAFSSYFEVSAPFRLVKCDWLATVGVAPYASTYYQATGFAVTNISLKATKTFDIKDKLSIPVYAGLTANPCTQKAYFTVGFAIQPNL